MNIVYLKPQKVNITIKDLKSCEQMFLWSLRIWVVGFMRKIDVSRDLNRAFGQYHQEKATIPLDHFMHSLSFGAKQTIDINCPMKASITPDELTLLNIFSNYQHGQNSLAKSMLSSLCSNKYLMQARYHAIEVIECLSRQPHFSFSFHQTNLEDNIASQNPTKKLSTYCT